MHAGGSEGGLRALLEVFVFQPDPKSVHFDLGVDSLADQTEVADMHDPWIDVQHPVPHEHSDQGIPEPSPELEPWAENLDVPGL